MDPGESKEVGKAHKNKESETQYVRNPDLITEDTLIPPLPPKSLLIAKPDREEYRERERKNRDKIAKLIEERKHVRNEKFQAVKRQAPKGNGTNHYTSLKEQIAELQQDFNAMKADSKVVFESLRSKINEAKENNALIKEYRVKLSNSKEYFSEELHRLERELMQKELTKQEEKRLTQQISDLTKKVRESVSVGNTAQLLEECEQKKILLNQQIQELKLKKEPLQKELDQAKNNISERWKIVDKMKTQRAEEKIEKDNEKIKENQQYNSFRDKKNQKLDKLQEQIDKIQDDIDRLWDDFKVKNDQHWEQKRYIDFINWQTMIKTRKINQKEKEKRKLIAQEREKERIKEEKKQKFAKEVDLCEYLVQYLQDKIKKTETKIQPSKQEKNQEINQQWAKNLTILPSKQKEEEFSSAKKQKKQKKPKEVKEEKPQDFSLPFEIEVQFESIKVLPPKTEQEIEGKIKEINERKQLFEKACREQIDENNEQLQSIVKKNKKTKQAKQLKEEDFPLL